MTIILRTVIKVKPHRLLCQRKIAQKRIYILKVSFLLPFIGFKMNVLFTFIIFTSLGARKHAEIFSFSGTKKP